MNLIAEQLHIASLIAARFDQLEAADKDDITIFADMADYMPGFKRLMDTSTKHEMDDLAARYPGFYHYAKILETVAAGIKSGVIKVPD